MGQAAFKLSAYPLADDLFDEDGFLLDSNIWNEDLAQHIAVFDGLGVLTDTHWLVIEHLREHYFRLGGVPAMRQVCRANGVTRREMYELFGGCREIWRIAGLPNPGEEAKAYF